MTLFKRTSSSDRATDGSRRIGAGEPVLLLHPFMLSHHTWQTVADNLSRGHDVLAVSLPGHYGGPPLSFRDASIERLADHAESELLAAGWQSAHIVGNSLGGWVALELARRGRALSVTAIAPAGGIDEKRPWDYVLGLGFAACLPLLRLGELTWPLADVVGAGNSRLMRPVAHDPKAIAREDARRMLRAAAGCRNPLQLIYACARSAPTAGLDDIQCPVHLVFCEKDMVIPHQKYAGYFTDRIGHARVTVLPGVGHCPHAEAPELVADLVRATVADASPAAVTSAR